ncbi:MAG: pseudaminic acid biosynthesis-associated methylase [Desulfamplus sp.]|nr:pseudaminic acid biosynthesis-associated methylase [Desulfamplus sp.]
MMGDLYKTEQESFWAGEFGDSYVSRNSDPNNIPCRVTYFAKILARTRGVRQVLEIGANIGHNFLAIKHLLPECMFTGIEINDHAIKMLHQIPNVKVHEGSILDYSPTDLALHDLTLSSGVLIHINPEFLSEAYRRLYECSRNYICLIEYYNPTPVEVVYRGHSERLFKRDFAGEMLDSYSDLELVDYGFLYHRDYNFPSDDATWFLLKKGNR